MMLKLTVTPKPWAFKFEATCLFALLVGGAAAPIMAQQMTPQQATAALATQPAPQPVHRPVNPGQKFVGDAPIAGYFGNTLVAWKDGKIFEMSQFQPNHMYRQYVAGAWEYLPWVLNSEQDASTICKVRTINSVPMGWCHAFAPYKKAGDHWVNPEYVGGHPVVNGGIPLVKVNGKWVVPDAKPGDPPLGMIYSLEPGVMGTPAPEEMTTDNRWPESVPVSESGRYQRWRK